MKKYLKNLSLSVAAWTLALLIGFSLRGGPKPGLVWAGGGLDTVATGLGYVSAGIATVSAAGAVKNFASCISCSLPGRTCTQDKSVSKKNLPCVEGTQNLQEVVVAGLASLAALQSNKSASGNAAADLNTLEQLDQLTNLDEVRASCVGLTDLQCSTKLNENNRKNLAQVQDIFSKNPDLFAQADLDALAKASSTQEQLAGLLSGLSSEIQDSNLADEDVAAIDLASEENQNGDEHSQSKSATEGSGEKELAQAPGSNYLSNRPAYKIPLGNVVVKNGLEIVDPKSGRILSLFERATRRYQGIQTDGTSTRRSVLMARAEWMRQKMKKRLEPQLRLASENSSDKH